MPDPMTRQLLARLAAQEARLATLEADVAGRGRCRPRGRRAWPLGLVVLLVALLPLSALATTPFNDLTGGVHDANIDAIYQAGLTRGCVPDVSYCPTANVTREEMASFLARLGGLGSNPPVANAKTALAATSADHATNADFASSAAIAGSLAGYAFNGLARVAATATPRQVILGQGPGQVVLTVTLAAPTDGFALVSASAYVFTVNSSYCPCEVDLRLADVTDGVTGGVGMQQTLNSGNYATGVTLGNQWVFPIKAGSRTFAMTMTGDENTVAHAVATALFVPFDGNGNHP